MFGAFGFGGAGGDSLGSSKQGYGGGSTAGVTIEPIGFLVVKEGSVRMINIAPPAKTSVDRMLDLVPDVMDKIESISAKNKE